MKLHLIGIAGTGNGFTGRASARRWPRRARLRRACVSAHVDPAGRAEHSVMEGFRPANLDWAPSAWWWATCVGATMWKCWPPASAASRWFVSRALVRVVPHLPPLGGGGRNPWQDHHLLADVLRARPGCRDPSFLIGGVPVNFRQSWHLGSGPEFVVEGDEYDTRVFRQEVEVPALPTASRDSDFGGIRPR